MIHVDAALARRFEVTGAATIVEYAETARSVYPELGCKYLPLRAGAYAVFAGPGSPISRAAGIGLHGPVTAGDLDLAEDFFRSTGEAPQVDLCPYAHPSLLDMLGERGYRIRWCLNVHFRELGREADESSASGGIRVESGDACDLELWARTVSNGFEGVDRPTLIHPSISYVTGQKPGVTRFLAYGGGEPAGGGALDVCDGIATFCGTSTRVGFRGMGVHTALLRSRLKAAAAAGCDLAVVLTSPGAPSQRNVERAGFRTAYTVIRMIR